MDQAAFVSKQISKSVPGGCGRHYLSDFIMANWPEGLMVKRTWLDCRFNHDLNGFSRSARCSPCSQPLPNTAARIYTPRSKETKSLDGTIYPTLSQHLMGSLSPISQMIWGIPFMALYCPYSLV